MRILFFSYAYPNPLQPGLGTFNRTMLAGLARQHAVRVVSPVSFVEQWKHSGRWDDRFAALPNVPADYPTWYYTPRLCRDWYGRFLDWSVGRRLRQIMREFQPDVVLSYWTHPDGEVAVRAAHEFGIPAVTMVGGSDVLLLARRGSRRQAILNVLHQADAVVAVSEHLAATLRDDGIDGEKIHVIGRGIDRAVFSPGDRLQSRRALRLPVDRPVLVGVGRLVPVKAWRDWLAACHELVQRRLNPACFIFGGGPLEAELRQQIHSLGLEGVVELRGALPQAELASWYRAADVTVLSSVSEGVPNVLLETLACGGSFVATDVGGIPEIADLRFDRLVAPQRPDLLAAAIADRLKHPPAPGLRRRWEPPSLDDAAEQLADLFHAVQELPATVVLDRRMLAVCGSIRGV